MLAKKIGSVQHPIVKKATSLRKNRKNRIKYNQICVLGKKLIEEVSKELPIDILFSLHPTKIPAKESYLINLAILKKISGVAAPDEMIAIVSMPQPQSLEGCQKVLILDQLQDPGNVGTLIRTALSFGWDGVYLTPNTVDLFNEKTLRASKGAVFHLPYDIAPMADILKIKNKCQWKGYVADLQGEDIHSICSESSPICVVLGSEGSGPSSLAKNKLIPLHIPIQDRVESLNVAIAGAIIMYALSAQ